MKKFLFAFLLLSNSILLGDGLDFSEAGRIVLQADGRKKPLDTFAAEALQAISGRRVFADPGSGQRIGATEFVFSLWFGERDWQKVPVILISDAQTRQVLGLPTTTRLVSLTSLSGNHALHQTYETIQAKRARKEELSPSEKGIETVVSRIEELSQLASSDAMTIVPHASSAKAAWVTPAQARLACSPSLADQIAAATQKVSDTFHRGDQAGFAQACRELRGLLAGVNPAQYPSANVIEREVRYNHLHPFRWAWLLYLASLIALLIPPARRVGLGLFLGGIIIHVYGFILRCQIAGYAPVTNMYESVVWVSLGVAGFAFCFSLVHRARIYLLTAAPLAISGLILADMLPSVLNPKIGPLPPVLRDNFWLATHVLTITLGYAAFALAMGLGHVILGRQLVNPRSLDERSPYHQLLYRVLQAGVLLLAIGTILGGVWANYAWGRFWGWDPKETWALIALLLYIFALHGRLAGWWRNFGLSVAAVVCFNGVLMAWYGVNFVLGKGLHSYGFGGGGLEWIGAVVGADLAFVGLCIGSHLRRQRSGRESSSGAAFTAAEAARS